MNRDELSRVKEYVLGRYPEAQHSVKLSGWRIGKSYLLFLSDDDALSELQAQEEYLASGPDEYPYSVEQYDAMALCGDHNWRPEK